MKKKILILGGGISRERLISLETAKSVFKELKKKNYTVLICEPDGNLLKKIISFKPWTNWRRWLHPGDIRISKSKIHTLRSNGIIYCHE